MRILLIICTLFFSISVSQAFCLKENAPKEYIVRPGDTLWSIANVFLKKPWEWKALWEANPEITNPDRLYPGAVIALRYVKGTPYIRVLSNGTIKLSPHMRITGNTNAVPSVPLADIKPFLNRSIVMDAERDRLINAPYIVAYSGEHLMGGQGDEVYVKKLHKCPLPLNGSTYSYAIYRPGGPYIHPGNKELLGHLATLIGYGILSKGCEPATVLLTNIEEGVVIGDRVLPNDNPEFNLFFHPTEPKRNIKGTIIDMLGGHEQEALGQVIAIDQGENVGLYPGVVLGLFSKPRLVPDPLVKGKLIKIPPERLGDAMIFNAFSKTSFALIVRSIRPIYLLDLVGSP